MVGSEVLIDVTEELLLVGDCFLNASLIYSYSLFVNKT